MRRNSFKKRKNKVPREKKILNTKIGMIVESLPNTLFRIDYKNKEGMDLEEGEYPIVGLNGKMKRFRIRILIGDNVEVLQDEYGGRGRIIKRLRN